jgi:glucokinase
LSYIAVDIGATNIRVALGNESGLKEKIVETTNIEQSARGIPLQIIKMIKQLEERPKAIGIGSIGPIDLKLGIITNTPNYPFQNIPLVKPLRDEFNTEITVLNDCTTAVFGEHVFGAGKDVMNLFYVTLSTGIGGGAIVDGHLLKGKDGNAVEIGHLVIDPHSNLVCGCGGKGHWEAYASGQNIPKFAKMLLKSMDERTITGVQNDEGIITTKSIFKSAKAGNELSLRIIEEIGKINSIGFGDIINMLDPELITVGGSIALNNPNLILDPIISKIDNHIINRKPSIKITPLGGDIVLHGALALALKVTHDPKLENQ